MLNEIDNVLANILSNHSRIFISTVRKHNPELLLEIEIRTSFLDDNHKQRNFKVPLAARLYCLRNNLKEQPRCQNPNCPGHNLVWWRPALDSFAPHCSIKCGQLDPNVRKKYEETCEHRYGVKNTFQSTEVKTKIKSVLLERYNVENPSLSDEFKLKKRKTFEKKYGTSHPLKCKRIKDKIRKTNEERYGGPAPMCDEKVKRKMAKTCEKKYGGIGFASEELAKKSIETTVQIYGKTPIEMGHEAAKSIIKSKSETELDDFIKSICDCEVEFNCRCVLSDDKELDIYIPSKRLAIEFNGDYWHMNPRLYDESYYNSQEHCTAKEKWEYDKRKQEECQSLGIQLIVVWEYDWTHSREDVENMLRTEFTKSR